MKQLMINLSNNLIEDFYFESNQNITYQKQNFKPVAHNFPHPPTLGFPSLSHLRLPPYGPTPWYHLRVWPLQKKNSLVRDFLLIFFYINILTHKRTHKYENVLSPNIISLMCLGKNKLK